MSPGARTPEELETLLEDAFVVRDRDALRELFEDGAVLVAGDGPLEARGGDAIARLVTTMWDHDRSYVAAPRQVLQARGTTLVVAEDAINVVRRGDDGRWRYAIALLNPGERREPMTRTTTAVLDFNPTVGMRIEGAPPDDPETEPWRAIIVFAPHFAGPPIHVHPHQEESYEVLDGVLDVFVDGRWRELGAGERLTVARGTPHTVRNLHAEEVRLADSHAPALGFPRFMACMHELVSSGKVRALPPKDPRSLIHLSMLFAANEATIVSVKPPQRFMRVLAGVGRRLGYELPELLT